MLKFLRKNTKLFAWFFVILLIFVFGLSSLTFNKHDQYAGEVFGKKISFQEFRSFETLTRMLPPSPQIAEDPQLEKQFTWQQIILAYEAKRKGFEVSNSEVQARVDTLVNPEQTHRISPDEYLQLLKSRRTTPNEFENGIRELIRIQKMISERFRPATVPAEAPVNPADKKESEKKAADELKKRQAEYIQWMSDIYQRAKVVDYSQSTQKPPVQEENL